MDRKPPSKSLRTGRSCEPNRCYVVTSVTHRRQPLLSDLHLSRTIIRAMQEEERRGHARTLAYVIMPDHLHWMLELGEGASLSRTVGTVKSVAAHRHGDVLWQDGFHDHAIRREESMVQVARYIIANPLRARLVQRIGDYPFWDAIWL